MRNKLKGETLLEVHCAGADMSFNAVRSYLFVSNWAKRTRNLSYNGENKKRTFSK